MNYGFWSKTLNIHFGYWRWGDNPFRLEPMLLRMNDFVASQMGVETGANCRILDLGCGFGATLAHLLPLFPAEALTGINNDPVQLQAAKSRCGGAIHLALADFKAMPFPADSFDVAFALESACFAEGETKSTLLREASRVLRPGGRLVVVDGFRKSGSPLPRPINWLHRRCLAAWGLESLAAIDGFELALKKQGFVGIETKDISWNVAPSLAHIPLKLLKLLAFGLVLKDGEHFRYAQALLLTFVLAAFKKHFGYYIVTCVKSTVVLEK